VKDVMRPNKCRQLLERLGLLTAEESERVLYRIERACTTFTCDTCGKVTTVKARGPANNKYCSDACKSKAWRERNK